MTDLRWLMDMERRLKPDGGTLWWVTLRGEIARLVRDLERPVILDAGCGNVSQVAADLGGRPGLRVGVDIDREAARNPDIDRFITASVERLPVRSGSVDLVISSYVIEHLPDPGSAFREIGRVLKPGGTAIVWTSNLLNYAILVAAITPSRFHNWVRRLAFPHQGKDNPPTYYRANTRPALLRALREAGLEPDGGVRFGAGAYHYWRFSKPLFVAAALASRFVSLRPLARFKNVLIVRCTKPARPGAPPPPLP